MTNRLRRFFGGRGYVILTALLVFLGHSTFWVEDRLLFGGYQEFLFGGLLILTIDIACFVCDDLRFLLMPAISSAFIIPKVHAMGFPYYSDFYLDHAIITLTYVLALALIGGLCGAESGEPDLASQSCFPEHGAVLRDADAQRYGQPLLLDLRHAVSADDGIGDARVLPALYGLRPV